MSSEITGRALIVNSKNNSTDSAFKITPSDVRCYQILADRRLRCESVDIENDADLETLAKSVDTTVRAIWWRGHGDGHSVTLGQTSLNLHNLARYAPIFLNAHPECVHFLDACCILTKNKLAVAINKLSHRKVCAIQGGYGYADLVFLSRRKLEMHFFSHRSDVTVIYGSNGKKRSFLYRSEEMLMKFAKLGYLMAALKAYLPISDEHAEKLAEDAKNPSIIMDVAKYYMQQGMFDSALHYYQKASDQGSLEAKKRLEFYEHGIGAETEFAPTVKLFEQKIEEDLRCFEINLDGSGSQSTINRLVAAYDRLPPFIQKHKATILLEHINGLQEVIALENNILVLERKGVSEERLKICERTFQKLPLFLRDTETVQKLNHKFQELLAKRAL